MDKLKRKINSGFGFWGEFVFRFRLLLLPFCLSLIVALVSQLPKITIDASMESFLHKNDPILVDYDLFREQFGKEEFIVIAFRAQNLFSAQFLQRLKSIHTRIEDEVPYLEELTSLVNARHVYASGDSLIIGELLEDWPQTDQDFERIKQAVGENIAYKNYLVDDDLKFTTLVVKIKHQLGNYYSSESNSENQQTTNHDQTINTEQTKQAVDKLLRIVEEYQAEGDDVYIAGTPIVFEIIKQSMFSNMRIFVLAALLTIIVLLSLIFRRVTGVVLPLVVVIVSLLSTVSLMSINQVSLKIPTQILPSFILAVGVGDSIHFLTYFYRRFQQTQNKKESIRYTLYHIGIPLVMTSVTTALGLLSFYFAEVSPISELGIYAAVGVGFALFYTLVLLPVLLSIIPLKDKTLKAGTAKVGDPILAAIARFSINNSVLIFFSTLLIIALSLHGITKIIVSHNPLAWLPEKSSVRAATNIIDHRLKGTNALEVVLDTNQQDGIYNPSLLRQVDTLSQELSTWNHSELKIGKIFSAADIIKEINQALNEGMEQAYEIPNNRHLVAQEFFLLEISGNDELDNLTDESNSKLRVTVKVPWVDVLRYGELVDFVEQQFRNAFPDSIKITLTGMISILARTLDAVIKSTISSYLMAAAVISIIMVILIGNLKIGLISMVPNFLPILCVLGLMGYLGLPLDMFTMLIGSIAIGLAVDDTIHFMHRFQQYYAGEGNLQMAVENTLQTTGRAMFTTSIVLASGFFIFCFADMNNLINFGVLTGSAILLALFSDFVVAPALLRLVLR